MAVDCITFPLLKILIIVQPAHPEKAVPTMIMENIPLRIPPGLCANAFFELPNDKKTNHARSESKNHAPLSPSSMERFA